MARKVTVTEEIVKYTVDASGLIKGISVTEKTVVRAYENMGRAAKKGKSEVDHSAAGMLFSFNKITFGITRVINRIRRIREAFNFMRRMLVDSWVRPMAQAILSAGEFSKQVAYIDTVLPATGGSIDHIKGKLFELSAAFGTSVKEEALTFYQVFSAGVRDSAGAVEVATAANRLALGGFVDSKTAVDGLTSAIHAYSASFDQAGTVSDIFFAAAAAGKTTVQELSHSIGFVAGSAAASGVSLADMAAALSTLTNAGVQTDKAAIGLNQILIKLQKITPAMAAEAKRLGIDFSLAAVRSKGLAKFLIEIAQNSKLTDQSIAKLFGDVRALRAFFGLARSGGEEFNKVLREVALSGGATEEALLKVSDTLGHQIDLFTAGKEAFEISIGEQIAKLTQLSGVTRTLVADLKDLARRARLGEFNADLAELGRIVGGLTHLVLGLVGALVTMQEVLTRVHPMFILLRAVFSETAADIDRLVKDVDRARQEIANLVNNLGHTGRVSGLVAFDAISERYAKLLDQAKIVGDALGDPLVSQLEKAGLEGKLIDIEKEVNNLRVAAQRAGLDFYEIFKRAQALRGIKQDVAAPPGGLPRGPEPQANLGGLTNSLSRIESMFQQLRRVIANGNRAIEKEFQKAEQLSVTAARQQTEGRLTELKSQMESALFLSHQHVIIRTQLEEKLRSAIASKSKARITEIRTEIDALDKQIDAEKTLLGERITAYNDAEARLREAKSRSMAHARELIGGIDSKATGFQGIVEEEKLFKGARAKFVKDEQDPEARSAGLKLFGQKEAELHTKAVEVIRQANQEAMESFIQLGASISEDVLGALVDLGSQSITAGEFWKRMTQILLDSLNQIITAMIQALIQKQAIAQSEILTNAAVGASAVGSDAGQKVGFPAALGVVPAVTGIIFGLLSAMLTKFATGGLVRGGTRGHDSVFAALQPGEYVLDESTVDNIKRGRPPGKFPSTPGSGGESSGGGGWGGDFVFAPTIKADAMPSTEDNLSMLRKGIKPAMDELAHRGVVIKDNRIKGRRK